MKETTLNLPNNKSLKIGKGVVYSIVHRYDPSAPDGLKQFNTTKFPNESGVDHLSVSYKGEIGNGIYDTGTYSDSPILSNMKLEEAESLVEELNISVVKPLERKYGPGSLTHVGEVDYWDKYIHTIVAGNRYHMDNPEDILALYLAILYGKVAPKDDNSISSSRASFSYVNVNKEKTAEAERRSDKFNSSYEYMRLRKDTKNRLKLVFEYLDLPTVHKGKGINKEATDTTFDRMSNGSTSYEFNKKFIDIASSAFTKEGLQKLEATSKVKHLIKTGEIKKGNDNIYRIEDLELGMTIEETAKMYVEEKNNPEVKKEMDIKLDKVKYSV